MAAAKPLIINRAGAEPRGGYLKRYEFGKTQLGSIDVARPAVNRWIGYYERTRSALRATPLRVLCVTGNTDPYRAGNELVMRINTTHLYTYLMLYT